LTNEFAVKVPKIIIELQTYLKMKWFKNHFNQEIFAVLVVEEQDDTLFVSNMLFPEQSVSGGHCKPTAAGLAKILEEMEEPELARGWFHTHGSMGLFFSGTDTTTIAKWGEGAPYLLSIVGAQSGIKARLDIFSPFPMTFDDVELEVEITGNSVDDECKTIIEKKVQKTLATRVKGVGRRRRTGPIVESIDTTTGKRSGFKDCPHDNPQEDCNLKNYTQCCFVNKKCPFMSDKAQQLSGTDNLNQKEFLELKETFAECPYPDPDVCMAKDYAQCEFYNPQCPHYNQVQIPNASIRARLHVFGSVFMFAHGEWTKKLEGVYNT